MSKMFSFVTATWNPLGGECLHNCYNGKCFAKQLIDKFSMSCYRGKPFLKQLDKSFKETDFVFVADMNDLFGDWVPQDMIQTIVDRVGFFGRARYLFLTKNPRRYLDFDFKKHMILGATIETNRENLLFDAPRREDRIDAMTHLGGEKFLSIEPIMNFDLAGFAYAIKKIGPKFVAVGYDNWGANLAEPPLLKTQALIKELEAAGIVVYRKTMREAVQPQDTDRGV